MTKIYKGVYLVESYFFVVTKADYKWFREPAFDYEIVEPKTGPVTIFDKNVWDAFLQKRGARVREINGKDADLMKTSAEVWRALKLKKEAPVVRTHNGWEVLYVKFEALYGVPNELDTARIWFEDADCYELLSVKGKNAGIVGALSRYSSGLENIRMQVVGAVKMAEDAGCEVCFSRIDK